MELNEKITNKLEIKKELPSVCVYCGCKEELFLTIDHIIPKCRGGTDTKDNMQITCIMCNQLKNNLTHQEYIKYFFALRKLKELYKIAITGQINIKVNLYHYPIASSNNIKTIVEEVK
jgi:hypothetical protein